MYLYLHPSFPPHPPRQIQDVQEQGQRYSLYLDLRAPTVLVPQNSESTNVILVKLGDLSLKNFFEDSEVGGPGVLQHWDHMYLSLDAVQVIRSVPGVDLFAFQLPSFTQMVCECSSPHHVSYEIVAHCYW